MKTQWLSSRGLNCLRSQRRWPINGEFKNLYFKNLLYLRTLYSALNEVTLPWICSGISTLHGPALSSSSWTASSVQHCSYVSLQNAATERNSEKCFLLIFAIPLMISKALTCPTHLSLPSITVLIVLAVTCLEAALCPWSPQSFSSVPCQFLLSYSRRAAWNIRLHRIFELGLWSGIILFVTTGRNNGYFVHKRDS